MPAPYLAFTILVPIGSIGLKALVPDRETIDTSLDIGTSTATETVKANSVVN